MRAMTVCVAVIAVVSAQVNAEDHKSSAKWGQRVVVYRPQQMKAGRLLARFHQDEAKTAERKQAPAAAANPPAQLAHDAASNSLLVVCPAELCNKTIARLKSLEAAAALEGQSGHVFGWLPRLPSGTGEVYEFTQTINQRFQTRRLGVEVPNDETVRIQKALDTPTVLKVRQATIGDVFRIVAGHSGTKVAIDKLGLRDVGMTSHSPVNLNRAEGDTLGVALSRLLQPRGLAYVVEDGVLRITSRQRLKNRPVLKVYPIGDLVATVRAGEPVVDFTTVVRAVRNAAVPRKGNGNDPTRGVTVIPAKLAIAVRQPPAGHARVAKRLRALRRSRDVRLGIAGPVSGRSRLQPPGTIQHRDARTSRQDDRR